MGKQFLYSFNEAAAVFSMGEVYHGDLEYTCQYQTALDGLLNYPVQVLRSNLALWSQR
jgi:alpha-amylase